MEIFSLTVNASLVSGTNADFPAYVDLSEMPPAFWALVTNGGGDIRCYSDSGLTTELAREVVSCDTGTDTGELWVKITSLTTSTVFYLTVDGTSTEPAAGSTYGSEAVWSDYRAVWHLNDLTDSTGNGFTLTNTNASASSVVKIGSGSYLFNGSNSYLTIPNGTFDNPGEFHYGIWTQRSGYSAGSAVVTFQHDYNTQLYNGNVAGTYNHEIFDGSTTTRAEITGTSQDVWYKMSAVFDGTDNILLVNGAVEDSLSANQPSSSNVASRIGAHRTGLGFYTGYVQEVRLRNSYTGANWELTEYNNQNTPDTFWTIASAIDLPTVTTDPATDITATSASGNGEVTDDGGADITRRGFVFGTTSEADPGNVSPETQTEYEYFVAESGTFGEEAFDLTLEKNYG